MANVPASAKRRSGKAKAQKGPSLRGCLLAILGAWAVWVLIDLLRLGVFTGSMSLGDAIWEMPSLGIPLVLGVAVAVMAVTVRREMLRKREFPDEPWMWEKRWNRSGTRPISFQTLVAPLTMAGLVLCVAVMAGVLSLVIVRDPILKIAVIPFYVAGLVALGWAGYLVARAIRSGWPFFRYDTFPFFIGQEMSGVLFGLERLGGAETVQVTLRMVEEERKRSGSRRSQVARTVLSEDTHTHSIVEVVQRPLETVGREGQVNVKFGPALAVKFALPASAKRTCLNGNPSIRWELQATAKQPGLDFDVTFLLPVY